MFVQKLFMVIAEMLFRFIFSQLCSLFSLALRLKTCLAIGMCLIAEYLGNDRTKNIEDILGPLPASKTLFRNQHFLLTCTIPTKVHSAFGSAFRCFGKGDAPTTAVVTNGNGFIVCAPSPLKSLSIIYIYFIRQTNGNGAAHTNGNNTLNGNGGVNSGNDKNVRFTTAPFVKEHLRNQIEAGGGKVYNHFEDVPKSKYKLCKLIAAHPCTTAKYIQCLAADIPVSLCGKDLKGTR